MPSSKPSGRGTAFRGLVREGKRKFATTLTVQGPTKADCRCSCSEAQRGLVCAHAIAVALAALQPAATASRSHADAVRQLHPDVRGAPARGLGQTAPRGKFDVFIPAQRIETMSEGRGQLPVFLQFQSGGEETDPVAQWLAEQGLRRDRADHCRWTRRRSAAFSSRLRGHPRVWEGRPGTAVEQRRKITVAEDGERMIELHARLEAPGSVAFDLAASQGAGLARSRSEMEAGTWQAPLLESLALGRQTWIWQREDPRSCHPLPEARPDIGKLIQECLDKKSGGAVRDLRWLARNLDALENVLPLETDEALSHLRLLPAEPRFVIELDGSPRQATARVEAVVGIVRHPLSSPNQETSGSSPIQFRRVTAR